MERLIILYFIIMNFTVLLAAKSIISNNKEKVDIKEKLKKLIIQKNSAPSVKTRTKGSVISAKT